MTKRATHPIRLLRSGGSMLHWFAVVLLLANTLSSCEALIKIGRRRIQCTTPIGGNPSVDALMDPRPNLPYILGFVGCQALLPSLGKCPPIEQIQPPWFSGLPDASGGICPPQYYSLAASAPGLVILGAAVAWATYVDSNRLLVTDKGLGTIPTEQDIGNFEETVLFDDITDWFMLPVGLVVKSAESTNFFPLAWDSKGLETLLEDRLK